MDVFDCITKRSEGGERTGILAITVSSMEFRAPKWYQRTSKHVAKFADQSVYCVRNARYNSVDHEGCEGVGFVCFSNFCIWRLKTKSR